MTQIQENKLPEWWIETTLGEVCEIKWWKRLPKWENLVNYKTNHPYIRITDLENNSINKKQLQFVTNEVFSSISRYIVNSWDVIISIVWSVWFIAKIDDDLDNASLTENCVKLVNLKNLDSIYLYYYLISQIGQNEIQKNTVWAVQKKLPIYWVQNISLSLPPLPEQQSIAKILSSFDLKIELLREQNETLEKIGQEIFKEWFWKYKVWDELPEGWRVGKLGEELETFLWWTPSKLNESFWQNWTIPWINSWAVNNFRIIEATEMITEEALKKSATKLLPKWTVVIAITWATLWQYSRLEIDCCFNQSVVWIKENKKIQSSYIYFWITNNIENVIRNATWWAHQHINKENVNQNDFLIPNNYILNKFYELVNPVMEKISINMFEIQTLSKTRDELLPKLMKGEVRAV